MLWSVLRVIFKPSSVTPDFFYVLNLILSLSTCSQSLKNICTWEVLGANVIKTKTDSRHTSFTKVSVFVDKRTLAKQHTTSRFVLVNIQMLLSSRNQPSILLRKHPNHKFTWKVLATAHSWLKE